jgi:FtsZ-interacting cell division protein ZipA
MGSINVTYALVALIVALIFLLLGFLWGRSKVRSRVEEVLEKQRPALAAREFTLRQQLDDAIVEISRLRPIAEELARVQERLRNEQMRRQQMEVEFRTGAKGAASPGAGHEQAGMPPKNRVTAESADAAIKKVLQSLERFNQPVESSATGELRREVQKVPQPAEKAPPAPTPLVKEPIVPQTHERKPSVPPSPEPSPQATDEWQEFARSLAAYRNAAGPPRGTKKR